MSCLLCFGDPAFCYGEFSRSFLAVGLQLNVFSYPSSLMLRIVNTQINNKQIMENKWIKFSRMTRDVEDITYEWIWLLSALLKSVISYK